VSAIWLAPASSRAANEAHGVGVLPGPHGRTKARRVYRAMRKAGINVWQARACIVLMLAMHPTSSPWTT
jgi:hypothetical protein